MKKTPLSIDTNKAPISVLTAIIFDIKMHKVNVGNFKIKMNYMTIKEIRKSLIREPNIDIAFKRDANYGEAKMTAHAYIRFYANDNKAYEIEASIEVWYSDVFTNDYYIKNYIYTYLKYMLENLYEVNRLYPLNLKYPDKLFIDDKVPALQALQVME